MIEKERTVPVRIQKNHVLLKRIEKNHVKKHEIESEQTRRLAGYKGEQAIDFYLSKLPEKDFRIFHNIRLSNGEYFFQIDTLVLCKAFALNLEVKNYNGMLYFDPDFNQFIQTNKKGEAKGYLNPLEQASQQCAELKTWLEKRNIPIPVDFLIIISKPSTILKTAPGYAKMLQKVKHIQFLLKSIEKIKNSCQADAISSKNLKKLSRFILKDHTPETFDILKYYGIQKTDIQTGVICPACSFRPMKRHFGTWFCPKCQFKDKNAHVRAIKDLFLLNNDSPISNRDICGFLHLSSHDTAKKILSSMQLPHTGTKKGRIYFPPPDYQGVNDLE